MKARAKKSRFRKVSDWLHLWLGLVCGLIVFIVCLTAAIWVFRDEIAYFSQPYLQVEKQDKAYLPPAVIEQKARAYLRHYPADSLGYLYQIQYLRPGRSAWLFYAARKGDPYKIVYFNPYNGTVLYHGVYLESSVMKLNLFLRAGHRFLWLPPTIGSPIVGSACILFLLILITGLIWWYPKKWNRNTVNKSFTIRWKAKWKRLNIDLHNVLGFYTLLIAFVLTVTGITYTFSWFAEGYFRLLNGGKPVNTYRAPELAQGDQEAGTGMGESEWWETVLQHYPVSETEITYVPSGGPGMPVSITVNQGPDGTIYHTRNRYFDPRNYEEIKASGFNSRNHSQAYGQLSLGQKIIRMNFDIHVGAIGGLPTKILTSLTCLICASLPITGFIIWYNRKWGKRRK